MFSVRYPVTGLHPQVTPLAAVSMYGVPTNFEAIFASLILPRIGPGTKKGDARLSAAPGKSFVLHVKRIRPL